MTLEGSNATVTPILQYYDDARFELARGVLNIHLALRRTDCPLFGNHQLEQHNGIEPSSSAWQADILTVIRMLHNCVFWQETHNLLQISVLTEAEGL